MRIIELLIDKLEELNGFDAVALVEEPAIEADFFAFNNKEVLDAIEYEVLKLAVKEKFVERLPGESKDSYIGRCIPVLKSEGYGDDQATAICYDALKLDSHYEEDEHKMLYVSVIKTDDGKKYVIDDTLLPELHLEIGKKYCIDQCDESNQDHPMRLSTTPDGIHNGGHTYLGEGTEEVEYQLDRIHFCPKTSTPRELFYYCTNHPGMGGKFVIVAAEEEMDIDVSSLPTYSNPLEEKEYEFESFDDYPESGRSAAKKAIEWKESHPDNDCGTRIGWTRARQLANGRPISEDTIARIASFKRHQQYKDVPYSEGCGGLMWDAWGGTAMIEWASNKLEKIRASKVSLSSEKIIDALPIKEQENIFKRLSYRGTYESKLKKEGYERVEPDEFFKNIFGLPTKQQAKGTDAITTKGAKVLYEYVGPVDSKIRKFCKRMMELSNKGILWSKSDLQNIQGSNPEFPIYYNIYEFKGSYGCRHNWRAVYLYQKQPKKTKVTVTFMEKAKLASKEYKFGLNEEKKRVVGPMLIPNKLILRIDEEGKPFYVYFSEDTVKQIAEKAMKDNLIHNINEEHNPDKPVAGYMVKSWIKESEEDLSNKYGMNAPMGTWLAEYKIEDDEIWDKIKTGVINGFSIEGFFQNNIINVK